jgi:hypothetical protein
MARQQRADRVEIAHVEPNAKAESLKRAEPASVRCHAPERAVGERSDAERPHRGQRDRLDWPTGIEIVGIPMYGVNNSFPVSVATGIVLAEWGRRRYGAGATL